MTGPPAVSSVKRHGGPNPWAVPWRPVWCVLVVLSFGVLQLRTAAAQDGPDAGLEGAPSPERLATQVVTRFADGDADAFERVYPFEAGRSLVRQALDDDWTLRPGVARVVWKGTERAVLLLSGHPIFPWEGRSTERETWRTLDFSGLYETRRRDDGWVLSERLPIERGNRILEQDLDVELEPGVELVVRARILAEVRCPYGLALRLNHSARIRDVTVNGRSADHESGESGHVRDQFFWHPVIDFNAPNGFAAFRVVVHAPADVQVVLDIPQTERTETGERIVEGVSRHPVRTLTFLYNEWQRQIVTFDSVRLALYATSDFEPARERVTSLFEDVYGLLSERYRPPPMSDFVIAQQRESRRNGWMWNHNHMIGAGRSGGTLFTAGERPQAPFVHEVAHWWIPGPSGNAADFLSEAWAMYAESIFLNEAFGARVEQDFFEFWRNVYMSRGTEGEASLLELDLAS